MTRPTLHPLAEDYLRRLRRASHELPRARRDELLNEIEGHLAEAVALDASDAEARVVLERVGAPEVIVEAERQADPPPRERRTWREWGAIILLPLGGLLVGVGWLVGLVLLWSSRLWTTRDKLIGTLIVPGGIATTLPVLVLIGTKQRCTQVTRFDPATGARMTEALRCVPVGASGPATTVWHTVLIALLVLGPLVSAVYLARRARRNPSVA